MAARDESDRRGDKSNAMFPPGQEPDFEYLAKRERVGWQAVTLIAGLIVVILVALWVLLALLPAKR